MRLCNHHKLNGTKRSGTEKRLISVHKIGAHETLVNHHKLNTSGAERNGKKINIYAKKGTMGAHETL